MKILLIDDDPDYHHYVETVLTGLGEPARCLDHSHHPEEAGKRIGSGESWDLYLVDWHFADRQITGSQLISAIFAQNPGAHVALCTRFEPLRMEPDLIERISNGRVTLLQKMGPEKQFLQRMLEPGALSVRSILILEDNADDAQLVADTLQKCTYAKFSTVVASNIREAKKYLESTWFDGFVLDYRLEGEMGTGIDFYKSLDAPQRAQPSILFTESAALDLDQESVQLIARGHLRFMSKRSYSPDSLTACFVA